MPFYAFKCPSCGKTDSKFAEKRAPLVMCGCGTRMQRDPQPPSTQNVETLDNGLMGRAIERPVNAEQMFKDRSKANSKMRDED